MYNDLVISPAKKGLLSVIGAILQPAIYFGSSVAKKDDETWRESWTQDSQVLFVCDIFLPYDWRFMI